MSSELSLDFANKVPATAAQPIGRSDRSSLALARDAEQAERGGGAAGTDAGKKLRDPHFQRARPRLPARTSAPKR